jgi:SAM-dependent methyltransferase
MIEKKEEFERLVDEAWKHEFSGWDFDFIRGRMVEEQPSWDYRQIVLEKIRDAQALLDLDTGGGEFLASLQPLPKETCATEGNPPNIPVARERLEPLGVKVFDTHAAFQLPFADGTFDLVIDRHGGILASEIGRVLRTGGTFLTQQVGGRNCIRLNEALQDKPEFIFSDWTMEKAVRDLEKSGLRIVDRREEFPSAEFKDIGAVVYYLKAVPWQVGDFSIEKYYDRLGEIQNTIQEIGVFKVDQHRFLIEAQKP